MRVLVVTLSNLGDVVLTLPVFRALRAAFPDAVIDALAGSGGIEALKLADLRGEARVYDKRAPWAEKKKLLSEIRSRRYDVIVDLRGSLIGFLGGARKRNRYFFRAKPASKHRADKHLAALVGVVSPDAVRPIGRGPVPDPHTYGPRPVDRPTPLVVAAVGSKSDLKKWPAASFAALLDRLVAERGCRVTLVGDRADARDAVKVRQLMKHPATDLTGKTDFSGLCETLRDADLVVTNDSAPLHLADALGTPVLALFGPTDPAKYGPRGPRSAMLSTTLFCQPCGKAQCRYNRECLDELSADAAFASASRLLGGSAREGSPWRRHGRVRPLADSPRFLVVRLDRIGDVVLSLPAISALRAAYPNARIAVMTRPATRELLEGHPDVDEVIPYFYEKGERHSGFLGNLRFLREIRKRRFDAAFILRPANRAVLVPFFSGIPNRAGLDSPRFRFFLTHRARDRRNDAGVHEANATLDVLRAYGIRVPEGTPATAGLLPTGSRAAAAVSARLGDESAVIALHPGSSCPSKRWPIERFERLAAQIAGRWPHRVAIVGGAEEKPAGERLAKALGARAIDLTGRLALPELAALLGRSAVLVSNDSGPVHVAAAVGTPTVTVYGRKSADLSWPRWHALGSGHHRIQRDVGCVVCLAHRCPIEFECLKAVEVDDVMALVEQALEARR